MKKLIKWYIKKMTREERQLRQDFRGLRLKHKQNIWLYFNNHPYENHYIDPDKGE